MALRALRSRLVDKIRTRRRPWRRRHRRAGYGTAS